MPLPGTFVRQDLVCKQREEEIPAGDAFFSSCGGADLSGPEGRVGEAMARFLHFYETILTVRPYRENHYYFPDCCYFSCRRHHARRRGGI